MKKIILLLFVAASLVACKHDKKDAVDATDATTEQNASADGVTVPVNLQSSEAYWKATKATGDFHEGTVPAAEGSEFIVKNDQLVGGVFIVDLTKLTVTDITDPDKNANLVNHLKGSDFFDVETYPTAKFKILEVQPGEEEGQLAVTGTLTVKGVSKNITVPAIVSIAGNSVQYESSFNIDRTDFEINYGSAKKITDIAKDKVINDVLELRFVANS